MHQYCKTSLTTIEVDHQTQIYFKDDALKISPITNKKKQWLPYPHIQCFKTFKLQKNCLNTLYLVLLIEE
jgi:hypothetical protein